MPLRRRLPARVGVNREKQIRALAVGDRRALLERDEVVRAAREDDVESRLCLEQLLQPQRDVEHELGLVDAVGLRARIVAAVARRR